MGFKRILPGLALISGGLGVATCAAGSVAVWAVGSRLSHVNQTVFEGINGSLATVHERVLSAQQRTQSLKLTTAEIRQGLEDRTRQEASQRVASRLDLESKAARVGAGLQEVDDLLELAGTTVESIRQAMSLGRSLGAPMDPSLVDNLPEQISSLQSQLEKAAVTVNGIRDAAARITAGPTRPDQLKQLVSWAVRAVATLGDIDVRLSKAVDRLAAAQSRSRQLTALSHRWIVTGQLGAMLLTAWMAAGQAALCVLGWRHSGRLSRNS